MYLGGVAGRTPRIPLDPAKLEERAGNHMSIAEIGPGTVVPTDSL